MSSCEHCENPGTLDERGLCATCQQVESICVLYTRRRGWTPAWEENLRRLTRRAKLRLPLFEDVDPE